MATYIHELPKWPRFRWSADRFAKDLSEVRHRQGLLAGRMASLGFPLQKQAVLSTLTEDVIKSSEIEGEILDRDQVRSSIARRLGMDVAGLPPADRRVEGVVESFILVTMATAASRAPEMVSGLPEQGHRGRAEYPCYCFAEGGVLAEARRHAVQRAPAQHRQSPA